jgi:hypothetical protein
MGNVRSQCWQGRHIRYYETPCSLIRPMSEGLAMLFTRVSKRRDAAVEKREYTPVSS